MLRIAANYIASTYSAMFAIITELHPPMLQCHNLQRRVTSCCNDIQHCVIGRHSDLLCCIIGRHTTGHHVVS
jgi:hypothetical protein